MNRGKLVAILTGAIAVVIAVGYLLLVALLDARGPMVPAPAVAAQAQSFAAFPVGR